MEKAFEFLDHLLDKDIVKKRRKVYEKTSAVLSKFYQTCFHNSLEVFIAGSRRDGICDFFHNDWDEMIVENSILCTYSLTSHGDKNVELTMVRNENLENPSGGFQGDDEEQNLIQKECSKTPLNSKSESENDLFKNPSCEIQRCSTDAPKQNKMNVGCTKNFVKQMPRVALRTRTEKAPPGYTFLETLECPAKINCCVDFSQCLLEIDNKVILRSDVLKANYISPKQDQDDLLSKNIIHKDKKGPSNQFTVVIPIKGKCFQMKYDDVMAFRCTGTPFLRNWFGRNKEYEWPPHNVKLDIEKSEVFVVPVGKKGHEDQHVLWRFSLNPAEIILVYSFNAVQLFTYLIAKNLVKKHLHPLCDAFSSYLVKNVIFWLSETQPSENFCRERLTERVREAFVYIAECVKNGRLSNYMIPERNMIDSITPEERNSVLDQIDLLLHGKDLVLQWVDLRISMDDGMDDQHHRQKYRQIEILMLSIYDMPEEEVLRFIEKYHNVEEESEYLELFINAMPIALKSELWKDEIPKDLQGMRNLYEELFVYSQKFLF